MCVLYGLPFELKLNTVHFVEDKCLYIAFGILIGMTCSLSISCGHWWQLRKRLIGTTVNFFLYDVSGALGVRYDRPPDGCN
jgi:hypothetical protein